MSDYRGFNLFDLNPDGLSPAVWAYIGDAVYELFVRHQLLRGGPVKTSFLHREATTRVRASFQAGLVMKLEPLLTEAELEILRRGRNIKSGHVPAYTDLITYCYSTAFEALIGYLYLSRNYSRLDELLNRTLDNGGATDA
jgi:ribonuclease-3 family protein